MGKRKKKYSIEQLMHENQLLRSQIDQIEQELTNRICHERKIRGAEEKRLIAVIIRQFSETLQLINPKLQMLDLVRAYHSDVDLQHHEHGGGAGDGYYDDDFYEDDSTPFDDTDNDSGSDDSFSDIDIELEQEMVVKIDRNMKVAKSEPSKSHHANVCPNKKNMGVGSKKRQSRMGGQKIQMQFRAIICTSVAIFCISLIYINFM